MPVFMALRTPLHTCSSRCSDGGERVGWRHGPLQLTGGAAEAERKLGGRRGEDIQGITDTTTTDDSNSTMVVVVVSSNFKLRLRVPLATLARGENRHTHFTIVPRIQPSQVVS